MRKQSTARGYEDGYAEVENLDYDTFMRLEEIADFKQNKQLVSTMFELMGEDLFESLGFTDYLQDHKMNEFETECYLDGWLKGVMEYWKKIKHNI